jgi:4-hydroxy-3-polyprenylbenzoate decarboxylase
MVFQSAKELLFFNVHPDKKPRLQGGSLLDAIIPYDWAEKPIPIELDPEMVKKIEAKWSEWGL